MQPTCSCFNLPQYTSGFTLIELVVAIALSTPVLFLIFFYLTDMEKGSLLQSQRSHAVETMRTCKKQIDNVVNSIVFIESISEIELRGRDIHDSLFVLRFSNKSIIRNNVTLCDKIKRFSVEKDQNCENKTVLLWECTLENGAWIGGGRLLK
ncbi:MAG TPA: prepilin-type N-terminal cleavage/methylation domain-containing protein [Chitinispirillaceae bacterium]|nr:prepilin-type N-terminal cleavage/methylation domain-containing protein [Chitinispirillaceae bacterium]